MEEREIVGRDDELKIVDSVLRTAGRLLFTGESGIGKTSMLQATMARAQEQGFAVLHAHCHRLEKDFAYGVVRQLFEPALTALPDDDRAALMSGAVAPAAAAVNAGAGPEAAGDHAFSVIHGLYWLVVRLAERRPLLLAVDDVHWADAASLRWLTYLGRRTEGVPIVIGASRLDGADQVDLDVHHELATLFTGIHLGSLKEAEVAALARNSFGVTPDPAFVSACQRVSRGNPFFVRALIDSVSAPSAEAVGDLERLGANTIASWVLARIHSASPHAALLAQAIAVLDNRADLSAVAAMTGLDLAEATHAADALIGVGFLHGDLPLRFVHEIVREAVARQIPPGGGRLAHARAARVMRAARRPDEQIAAHLLVTDPLHEPWVAPVLRAAAAEALQRGVPDVAVTYLRRALEEPLVGEERVSVLADLGHAELRTDVRAATRHLTDAFEQTGDPRLAARVAEQLAPTLEENGSWQSATRLLDRAIERLGENDQDLAARLDGLALVMTATAYLPESGRLAKLQAIASKDLTLERAVAACLADHLSESGGSAAEVIAHARRALALGPPATVRDLLSYELTATALCRADDLELAGQCGETMIARGKETREPLYSVKGHGIAARVSLQAGRLCDAVAEYEAGDAVRSAIGGPVSVSVLCVLRAYLEQGLTQRAARLVEETGTGPYWQPELLSDRALFTMLLLGDAEAALADHLACGRYYAELGITFATGVPWRSRAALVLHKLGRTAEAADLAEQELHLARAWGTGRAIGVALRARGLVAGTAAGLDLLAESAQVLNASPARLEHAHTLFHLGVTHHRLRHVRDARALLGDAYRIAVDCGATVLADRTAEAIRRSGGRRPRTTRSGLDALTPQERRVAERAAAGASNRDIAEEMFLTLRTVETHLTSTYRKLGVDGRASLEPVVGRCPP